MALTFRDVKLSPLTKEEADANIRDLDGRITTLQSGGTGITKTGTPADNQIAVWTGANSLEGTTALTLSGDLLSATWVDSGNIAGPNLRLFRDSASPLNNDNLGEIRFEGKDAGGNVTVYARIHTEAAVVSDGSEAGRLIFLLPLSDGTTRTDRDLLKLGPTAEMALISADTAAAIGPVFVLDRTSTSPTAADNLGQITFRGRDSVTPTANTVDYATIKGVIADATDGSEDGSLEVQIVRGGGAPITMLQVTANGVEVLTGILKLPSAGSRPTASSAGVGAVWYDPALGQPVYSNGSTWADALRGKLSADLDAAGFAIGGNKPKGFIVNGSTPLLAAHNGSVIRCTNNVTNPTILTWANTLGDFSCLVHADIPSGQTVIINGTGGTDATIPAGCCATLLQVTSNVQNVWVSDPRTVVGT